MDKISGREKKVGELLRNSKFAIDYYQREYRWGKKQISDLMDDLDANFMGDRSASSSQDTPEFNGHYFLGSIVISPKEEQKYIVDGQQRLTSLTLLLIYAYHQINNDALKKRLINLICAPDGKKESSDIPKKNLSFNLDIQERYECMKVLLEEGTTDNAFFKKEDLPVSVRNIRDVYECIEDSEEPFPNILGKEKIAVFIRWLLENVSLIVIESESDSDAYVVFETMNDRGLMLKPEEMLKSYLLSRIGSKTQRDLASGKWEKHITALRKIGKDSGNGEAEVADAIRAWLRSQYAKKNDFDIIGSNFHRWVREEAEKTPPKKSKLPISGRDDSNSKSVYDFIRQDFDFYIEQYQKIREYAENYKQGSGLEAIYYNAQNKFTLQYPALLAPLVRDDRKDGKRIDTKLRIVANYFDIITARRIWNSSHIGHSAMRDHVYSLIEKIRGRSVQELSEILIERLEKGRIEMDFMPKKRLRLHGQNRGRIHYLLARMAHFMQTRSKEPGPGYLQYAGRGNKFEIEHIWPKKPSNENLREFGKNKGVYDRHAYDEYRDYIGGLLLLDKSKNTSYGKKQYKDKRRGYSRDKLLLVTSLCEEAYEEKGAGNVKFKKFRKEFDERPDKKITFRSCSEFNKVDLDYRQDLYRKLAGWVWDPDNLKP